MEIVSDQHITAAEFEAWQKQMMKQNVPVMTSELAQARRRAAEQLRREFVYSTEVVGALLARRKLLPKVWSTTHHAHKIASG